MNFTWITLACLILAGVIKLTTWLLSDKRQLKKLRARQYELEEELRTALAKGDSIAISSISVELDLLRRKIKNSLRK